MKGAIDALCYCLGEFRELTAFAVSQRDRIPLEVTGEIIPKTAPDQLVVNGIGGGGAVVSFQIRGGMTRGTIFLFDIHGEKGVSLRRRPPFRDWRNDRGLGLWISAW